MGGEELMSMYEWKKRAKACIFSVMNAGLFIARDVEGSSENNLLVGDQWGGELLVCSPSQPFSCKCQRDTALLGNFSNYDMLLVPDFTNTWKRCVNRSYLALFSSAMSKWSFQSSRYICSANIFLVDT